ncbi:MAG TPA: transporter [Lacunisphaera sp.]|nr:transporter [Lacunisphaera sp.]
MYRFLRPVLGLLAVPLAAGAAELRELSTDRPDQTESPQTVDAGHWQIETDLVNYTRDHNRTGGGDLVTRDLTVGAIDLKYGLTDRMDVQVVVDPYVNSRVTDRMAGLTTRASGFGEVTTRLKFNFWGNDGGSTACAIMPFVKWPLSASGVRNGETEGGVMLILGYELPAGWGSAMMTEVEWVDDGAGGRDVEWVNSITFAHDLTARLGGYVELFTVTGKAPGCKWQVQFDVGLTYAVSPDIQLDAGCNFALTRAAPDFQPFVGFSRRF